MSSSLPRRSAESPKSLTRDRTAQGVTIGTLGALIGVSPTTMRFYEDKGIVNPEKDADNSYRRYRPAESCALLLARRCQGFGISLEKTAALVTAGTANELVGALVTRERELGQEMTRIRHARAALKDYIEELRATIGQGEDVVPTTLPSLKYVFTIESGFAVEDAGRLALAQRWMQETCQVAYSVLIPEHPEIGKPGCRWGFAKRADELLPEEQGLAELFPACDCGALALVRDRADRFCPNEVSALQERFAAAGFQPRGPLRGTFLTIVGSPEAPRYLFRIYAPIYR